MKEDTKFIMIAPSIPEDVNKLLNNLYYYEKFLPIKKIIIIGSSEVKKILDSIDLHNIPIDFMDECSLINLDNLKTIIYSLTKSETACKRAGWYAQQFIKMKYSEICREEYYLLWDSDTIPLKKVDIYNEKPYFDLKGEYHKPYFDTIERLIPGLKKNIKKSFISEHMLVKTDIMRELIHCIESNRKIGGKDFQEKILRAIDIQNIAFSGFSEFETFGTYTLYYHSKEYNLRDWKSLRCGGFFFENSSNLDKEIIAWLQKTYDAISFEKRQRITKFSMFVQNRVFRKVFSPIVLDILAIFIKLKNKVMRILRIHKGRV